MASVPRGVKCVVCGEQAEVNVPGWNRPSPDEPMCVLHADEAQTRVLNKFSRLSWAIKRKLGSKD